MPFSIFVQMNIHICLVYDICPARKGQKIIPAYRPYRGDYALKNFYLHNEDYKTRNTVTPDALNLVKIY